ncbi:MAG TPA: molybdopterin-dependent oxidoreductase [Caldilineae bacterium]|nr:molybdopterin-dependent oxidoreductase [Caldilineae bacterium]
MKQVSRRWWLKAMGGSLIGLWAAACQANEMLQIPTAEPTPVKPTPTPTPTPVEEGSIERGPIVDGIRVTTNKAFFSVSYRDTEVAIDVDTWRLKFFGNVERELNLSLDEIMSMPVAREMRTLECISNPVGGDLISNAVWEGIRLADLLDMAGVKPDTKELVIRGADDFHTAIPIELARDERSILVYRMNGEPLPAKNGFPLRALWPGRYGMKQPKWIVSIEAITGHHLGHWERLGWSNEALIKPNSQIERPKPGEQITQAPYRISGRAFAGRSGVAKVEVSVDQGETWHEATLIRVRDPALQPYVWTLWYWDWGRPRKGRVVIQARATDGNGVTQSASSGDVFPDGTNAIHRVAVTVA